MNFLFQQSEGIPTIDSKEFEKIGNPAIGFDGINPNNFGPPPGGNSGGYPGGGSNFSGGSGGGDLSSKPYPPQSQVKSISLFKD